MRGARSRVALLVGLFVLAAAVQPAAAHVVIDSAGRVGAWTVADSESAASVGCIYEDDNLAQLTVAAPQMLSQVRPARRVSWQVEVWRARWWMKLPDQWHLAYQSPIAKARATRTTSPVFASRQWIVPAQWRTAYDSFKVRLILRWYAADRVTQVGQTTVELEYFDARSGPTVGHCAGSFTPPTPPPPGTTATAPADLARMSHWRPYWKKFNAASTEAMIAELTRMHQTGVVLTGIETGNKYALPPDVGTYLTMLRNAGIKPYLALWISRFSDAEVATTLRAWNAGNGQWAGIVLDVERGLELFTMADRAAAVRAIDRYMESVRPLSPFIAASSFGIISDYPNMPWSELNAHVDAIMPQVYFREDVTALTLLDRMQASIDFESESWSEPPKPIVPVVNDWGNSVDLEQLEAYIEICFARYGAVSGWRLHPNMHAEVKDLWGTFPP